MDPEDAKRFAGELEALTTDVASGSSASTSASADTCTPITPANDHDTGSRKRSYAAFLPPTECSPYSLAPPSVKRPKPAPAQNYAANMHPLRRALLEEQSGASPRSPPAEATPDIGLIQSASLPYRILSGPGTATSANVTPVGAGRLSNTHTWSTLRNAVRRQWDPRKADLDYDEVLKHRRQEKLDGVDRYVPLWFAAESTKKPKPQPFAFEKLPESVRGKTLGLLLVSAELIEIDFTWLRPFVKGHARVPAAMQKLTDVDKTSYVVPVHWSKLTSEIDAMKTDMAQFKHALETRGVKTKSKRSPARHLETQLFRVSRSVHKLAARAFYGGNTFHFPYAPAAWVQLESFLETIGSKNVEGIKHLRIPAPMFHRGLQEDFVEGAVLDVMSPATRLAVVQPPSRDRLLSAITSSVRKLMAAGTLQTLAIDLEHPMAADLWAGRYVNDKRLISVAEAEKHVERKGKAMALLKQLSDALAAKGNRPVMTLCHFTKPSRSDVKAYHAGLPTTKAEAAKYGWKVSSSLASAK